MLEEIEDKIFKIFEDLAPVTLLSYVRRKKKHWAIYFSTVNTQ